jgi:nicotinamidase-related amidase
MGAKSVFPRMMGSMRLLARARSDRLAFLAAALAVLVSFGATSPELHLKLRTRVELYKGSGDWREVALDEHFSPSSSAMILCDMWDKHWCQGAAGRVEILAHKAAPIIDLARSRGVLIIHAPSDTMQYYKGAPQHLNILAIPAVQPPADQALTDPPLPIDDSDGGCDTPNNPLPVNFRAWTKEHAAIHIAPSDLISDDGREVYNALQSRGIKTLFVAGVHANMCILKRTFAIRQMTRWGVRCILIRDLTDAMYNPARRPFVSHEQGTQLVIEHIEKYWVPTATSEDLERVLKGN